ncbi:hypothetical protein PhCBS80983_g00695 [Powellomyces hirtus]|uniref:Uncharacterized protein n=1 Tax=Powellomyces hirtus TaxID=109895 RepID=A0A507EG76_9FUNG|nr:hypothetical protein PhCBS80983_g00695 [Powellomyces hirtus]
MLSHCEITAARSLDTSCRRTAGKAFSATPIRSLKTSVPTYASSRSSSLVVSSPHPTSHIRLIRFQDSADPSLTEIERSWKLHREDVQRWHHAFWQENNKHFVEEKAAFENQVYRKHNRSATPHELSTFYKQYLDTSFDRHAQYNKALWKENTRMLALGLRAELSGLWRATGQIMLGLDMWWHRMSQTIVRVGGGHRAQGITFR